MSIGKAGIGGAGITGVSGGSPTVALAFNQTTSVISGVVKNPGGVAAGLTVTIAIDGATVGTATTAANGAWSYTASGLSAGAHTYTATTSVPVSTSGTIAWTDGATAPGGGPNNTADHSDPNNAYLAALAA